MKVSVTLRRLIIKDNESSEEYAVSTIRTAEEISSLVEEMEREQAVEQLSEAVWEAYQPRSKKAGKH